MVFWWNCNCTYHSATHGISDFLKWPGLPAREFPIICHHVEGENQQESSSPSWFNIAEVEVVLKYVKDLIAYGCPPDDIAIISPYHKQVQKIRKGESSWVSVNRVYGQPRFDHCDECVHRKCMWTLTVEVAMQVIVDGDSYAFEQIYFEAAGSRCNRTSWGIFLHCV